MGAKRSRDERKLANAERRREQQARDRRQRRIVYGVTVPIVLLIIAVVPFTNWYHAHQRGKQHAVGYVRAATSAAKAAGCTGVRNDRQIPTSLVKAGTTVDYAKLTAAAKQSLPPTSGPRETNPLPATPVFYALADAPRPERAVGNLDHGFIVVWYDDQLAGAQVKVLKSIAASNSRTIVVPWTRSVFPDGRHVVFTAWDRTQRCTSVSAAALASFAATYRDAGASGQGWASPSAPTPNGAAGTGPKASTSATPSASASPKAGASAAPSASATPRTAPTTAPIVTPPATPSAPVSFPKITVTPIR